MWHFSIGIVVIFGTLCCSNGNVFNDVEGFVSEFASMTDAGADVLEKLGHIGKGTFSLLKFAGPIGQLVYEGASIGFKEDSPELMAIRALENTITTKFAKLTQKIEDVAARRHYEETMRSYENLITVPIQYYEHYAWAAAKGDETYVEKFKKLCQEGQQESPMRQLMWLYNAVNTYCAPPTEKDGKAYAKVHGLLRSIDNSVHNILKNSSDYEMWRTDLLISLTELPNHVTVKYVDYIEQAFDKNYVLDFTNVSTVAELSERFDRLFLNTALGAPPSTDRGDSSADPFSGSRCLLKTISTVYKKRRDPVLDHANFIISDSARFQVLGLMCATVEANGNNNFYRSELRKYDELLKNIANGMKSWVSAELESSWPEVILSHCKDELGGSTDIAEDQYDAVALRIQNAANERGSAKYLHQVVVTPAWQQNKFFLMKCFNSASCAAIFAEKGVHIVVTRIDEMEHSLGERLRSAHEQVDIYRAKLQKDIINQLYMYGGQSPMNHILSLSAALNQHLFGKFVWRHFVALHNRKWFLMQCTVPTGIAGPVIQGLYAYNNKTEAVDDPFYSVANKYKIIFLL